MRTKSANGLLKNAYDSKDESPWRRRREIGGCSAAALALAAVLHRHQADGVVLAGERNAVEVVVAREQQRAVEQSAPLLRGSRGGGERSCGGHGLTDALQQAALRLSFSGLGLSQALVAFKTTRPPGPVLVQQAGSVNAARLQVSVNR